MPSTITRTCHIKKKPDEEFEFFLRADDVRKGQIITSVTPKGPADRAGLKNGDRIITINGSNVEKKGHREIVEIIEETMPQNEIVFEVVDEANDPNKPEANTKTNGSAKAKPLQSDLRPRLCKMKKKGNSFGFHLEAPSSSKAGHFIKEVAEGGAAADAGVRQGDRIIEVGGTNVEKMNHNKVVSQIKKSGDKVTLLVVDAETYRRFSAKKQKIKAKHASTSSDIIGAPAPAQKSEKSSRKSAPKSTSSIGFNEDEKARLVHVIREAGKGFGFFLRVRKNEKGEYVGNVESGKPGSRCGLMEDDLVLAVNGKAILTTEHEEVVGMIKSNPNHALLLVAGSKALENARNKGLLSTLVGAKEQTYEKPRKVKLTKGENGYGFYLKMDASQSALHVITDVENDSPADKEGLKDGDVVANVGSENVLRSKHDDCVEKIKAAGNSVEMTVGNEATMKVLYDLQIELTDAVLDNWPEPDVCKLPDMSPHDGFFGAITTESAKTPAAIEKKESDEPSPAANTITVKCTLKKVDGAFGFFLRDESGHFLGNIEEDGAAHVGGIKENDQILEINNVDVQHTTHAEVVEAINDSGDEVTFLVRRKLEEKLSEDEEAKASTSSKIDDGQRVEPKPTSIPLPRFCQLEKLSSGYGFHLNTEGGDRPGQYMRKVVDDGAASNAGVREGDRVVEVNGISLRTLTHDDIVKTIRESGNQFNVLVVDEEADLYYKSKGIEITKALLVAKAIAEKVEDTHSNASSTIEAEATVHVDPDEEDKPTAASIAFPPPPAYDEKENEEVAELIDEAIKEAHEDREEKIAEKLEEIADEIVENKESQVSILVESASDAEELKDEIREKIENEVVEEIKEDIVEEIKEDIVEEIKEDIVEQIKEDIVEEIKEDIVEEMKEDIANGLKVAAAVAVVDKIRDAVEEEREMEELKEEIKDEIEKEQEIEQLKDEIQEEIKEEIMDEIKEEIKEEIIEEAKETQEEYMERMKKEMREKIEREMREKVEEEMRQKLLVEAAAAAPPPPPEPPKFVPAPVVINAVSNAATKPTSPVKKAPARFTPKVDQTVAAEDIAKMVRNLRSVKKPNDLQHELDKHTEKTENKEEEENAFKPSFRSARAMFEGGAKQPVSNSNASWRKNTNTSVKQPANNYAPKNTASANNADDKGLAGRQTSWSGGGMKFKIVETSATFN